MELSEEELRRIEGRWKSDVDLKLDRLVRFADKYETLMQMLLDREKRRKDLWDAVIQKTTAGLLWAGVLFIANALWTYIKRNLT